ncbi:hypothetical protein IU450_02080 [Nocardia abscessus]|uniref:hypothetical protein n=1 Tax=Nocardia abscessus TaxID=120957 RepID=UPI001894D875|nr:hypothetical protein [Nocardia abscessus]MBF6334668.1 hypothetical protein [Nocardia abscessus]
MDDETSTPKRLQQAAGPAGPSAPASSFDLAELQHSLRIATRNGRYALVTAVAAAVISAGVSAWASTHVSSTEMNRQERFTAAQAVRKDRREVYVAYVASFMDVAAQLGRIRAALEARPPNHATVAGELSNLQEPLRAHMRAEAAVRIVGSEMGPTLARRDRELSALMFEPADSSLMVVRKHLDQRPGVLTDDDEWRRVAAVGLAAIEKYVSQTSIDEIAEQARADLGSG